MQLRFIPPTFLSWAGLKQSLSAVLTGMAAIGTITAVAFNIGNSRSSIAEYLDPLRKTLISDTLLGGINKLGNTFHSWGSSIVGLKDAFKEWVHSYLNPSGLKAGAVALYKKLYDWANIVYSWFATKFIEFLGNIPEMVKKWDELRLSLFKWGTFLGGGGGAALWSMFGGSFDNLGKLAELMGNPDFREAAEKFGELVQKNPDAFENMGEEEMKEIFERITEDPEEAKEIIDGLLKKQEDMIKKAKEEKEAQAEEEKQEKEPEELQLEQKEVEEAFSKSKGGKPQSKAQVFGNMIGEALNKLAQAKYSSYFDGIDAEQIARQNMKNYLNILREDVKLEKNRNKTDTAKQKFLDSLKDNNKEEILVNALARVTKKAYDSKFPKNLEALKQAFVDSFNSSFTKTCTDDEADCGKVNFDANSIKPLPKKVKK